MTELQTDSMELLVLAKAFSAKSAYLIGKYKHKQKQRFKQAVISVDAFIKEVETPLKESEVEIIEDLIYKAHKEAI